MKFSLALFAVIISSLASAQTTPPAPLTPPVQDQGLPYTRSAVMAALAKIKDGIAAFPGSRYGYIKGYRVRLDDTDLLQAEAVEKDGVLYVPGAFAAAAALKEIKPAPVPADLASIADRWVYAPAELVPQAPGANRTTKLTYDPPAEMATLTVKGATYYSLADVARNLGMKVTTYPRGLYYVGETPLVFSKTEAALFDSVVALFDTPEKLADPDLYARSIPSLSRQGKWTSYVKASPEQIALLNGPETDWPITPKSEYDYQGFDEKLLGSKRPAPGLYPRVLFSPEDVPMLAARVKGTTNGQMSLAEMEHNFRKSWWDPQTSDGQVFEKLASGNVAGLEWDCPPGTPAGSYPHIFKGQKPGIYSSHISYVEECLTTMALYCLLTADDEHGKKAAAAIANYYKLREPLLDEINATSDSEYGSSYQRPDGSLVTLNGIAGSTSHWRTHGGGGGGIGAHMNLGLALDFSGKWMTGEEKNSMRRFIAKATYGKRAYGQDGPRRWRDINWVTWDLSSYLALAAIEGLPGFDAEAYADQVETVRSFCEWGIDNSGVVYESNGKTPGGFQFLTLSMVGMARRGENFWGHPHLRKLLEAQVQSTSPTGRVTVNSGTQYVPFSRQFLSFQFVDELKTFFPAERNADYLLTIAGQFGNGNEAMMRRGTPGPFDPKTYAASLNKVSNLRMPSPTYPGFVYSALYDADFKPVTREDLKLPLDFNAPVHGLFSSYSDNTSAAAWINLLVRPDHYLGAGHHHADAGMFHFSALGVDWFTQSPFSQAYDGKLYNLVQVDGHSEAESIDGGVNGYNAKAKYLGAISRPLGAVASADLTYAYSYRWMTQAPQTWNDTMKALPWELEPDPEVSRIFAGTARYKMRPWWSSPNFTNYFPTCRSPFNPMQYVYRSTGLIRGAHPYGFVIDDLDKDGQPHLFQWAAMLNGGVGQAEVPGLPANQIALAYRAGDPKLDLHEVKPAIHPQLGEPLLLVCALGMKESGDAMRPLIQVETAEGPKTKAGVQQFYDRLLVNQQTQSVVYKILLLPFKSGETLPAVTYDSAQQSALIQWSDQSDALSFSNSAEKRTRVKISRNNAAILEQP